MMRRYCDHRLEIEIELERRKRDYKIVDMKGRRRGHVLPETAAMENDEEEIKECRRESRRELE
jgi:hypothetical protein